MEWCLRYDTRQYNLYTCDSWLDFEDAWKAIDDLEQAMKLLKLLCEEARRDSEGQWKLQQFFYIVLRHHKHVMAREALLDRCYPPLRQSLKSGCIDHMLGIALSVISTRYDPLFECIHDEILERRLQYSLRKGIPTSYVEHLQQRYACLLLLKGFQQHHTLFPYVHIKYAIALGVQ